MIAKTTANGTPAVPSRNALRVLRNLALAGSTCATAAITYDIHRRIRVAERIVENKRALQTSAPSYDATAAARRLGRMMEAAEAGEFMGIESLEGEDRRPRKKKTVEVEGQGRTDNQPVTSNPSAGDSGNTTQSNPLLDMPGSNQFRISPNGGKRGEPLAPRPFPAPESSLERYRLGTMGSQEDLELEHSTGTAPDSPSHDPGVSLAGQMNDLLDQDRPIEAAQLYMEAFPLLTEQMSSDVREVAVQAFYVNCKEQNVFIARGLFKRLDETDEVSLTMWRMLLFALAKKGCIESVSTLYTDYIDRFKLPPILLDIVLRCLVESHRLTAAKSLLFKNLKYDRDCGLCGAYLAGIWRKTRNIELLNTQLKKMLNVLPRAGKRLSDKLFNPVLKAYVEFGRLTDAETLVHDMVTKHNIPLRCRTKGLLVFGKALNADWEGVERGLQEMYDSGMTQKTSDFIQIFDRIFLEYWVSHSGAEIRRFVFHYIGNFNLKPDRVLYKHILEAFIEKGNESMIVDLNTMAKERKWNIPFSHQQFLELLRSRRLALESSPVGFWKMLQAARAQHGQAATSQRILGYDQRSFPSTDVNKMPFTGQPMPWYERSLLECLTPPRRADQYQKLSKLMSHYMHVGKMPEAISAFQTANKARYHMKQPHIELALIATLLQYGLKAAQDFMQAESQRINSLFKSYPDLLAQISEGSSIDGAELLKAAVFRFYELSATTPDLQVKHHITASVSHRLISSNKADQALDLLTTVYMSHYRKSVEFTGVCMKMFIRAFASLDNIEGVRWCIMTGLSRRNAVNHAFVVEVRRILATLNTAVDSAKMEYFEAIADMLEKKNQGDAEMMQLCCDPDRKRLSRRKPKGAIDEITMYDPHSIVPTVEAWDEERELEAVLDSAGSAGSAAAGGMV